MTNEANKILDEAVKVLDNEAQESYKKNNQNIDWQRYDNILSSPALQEVIKTAYLTNPVMSAKDITNIISENLPRYQRRANLKWLKQVTKKTPETVTWYYENGDTLFVRKGTGWAFVGGGFQEVA